MEKAARPDPNERPDHIDAARALALALVGVGLLQLFALAVPRWRGPGLGLVQQAMFLGLPLAYAVFVRLSPLEASGFASLPFRRLALVLLASFGTMWLLQGLNELQPFVFKMLGLEKEVAREREQLVQGLERTREEGSLFTVLLYGIASPLCEETLFRGLVFKGLARRIGPLVTILATSAVFAALHETKIQFALMLLLGIYFGTVRWLTGSLWASILAHAANNGAVLLLTAIYGARMDNLHAPAWMYPLSAVVFAGAIALLAIDRPRNLTSS